MDHFKHADIKISGLELSVTHLTLTAYRAQGDADGAVDGGDDDDVLMSIARDPAVGTCSRTSTTMEFNPGEYPQYSKLQPGRIPTLP